MPGSVPRKTLISEAEFRGQKIFFLNFVGEPSPFSPAWCITDSNIVFGLFPQTIKAYLSRQGTAGAAASGSGKKSSLANVPEVAELFASGGAPTVLSYQDTPNTFKFVYPLTQFFAQFAFSELQHQGIDLDMSILPNARAIMPHLKPNVFTVQSTKNGIRLETRGTLPTGMGGLPLAAAGFLLPATAAARDAAQRTQSMNNLKQISLGLLNFEDQHRTFTPAFMADKNDKPLLSSRVLILPFLEENELFNQFKLDEPWDSENNKKLIEKMPRVYAAPESKAAAEFKTVYLGVRGENAAFPGVQGAKLASFTDGTSRTITVVEASDDKAVIWTKPDDFEPDAQNPIAGLVGLRVGGFLAAFADGHVQMISQARRSKRSKHCSRATAAKRLIRAHSASSQGGRVLRSQGGRVSPRREFASRRDSPTHRHFHFFASLNNSRAFRNTRSNIASVSLPVNVFCWLG